MVVPTFKSTVEAATVIIVREAVLALRASLDKKEQTHQQATAEEESKEEAVVVL
jgi:hypothetical protein